MAQPVQSNWTYSTSLPRSVDRTDPHSQPDKGCGSSTDYGGGGRADYGGGITVDYGASSVPDVPMVSFPHWYQSAGILLCLTKISAVCISQLLFCVAMMFLLAGIVMCIWGYLGLAIRPFQIFGPACIGAGLCVYLLSCLLCCKHRSAYEMKLDSEAHYEHIHKALSVLSDNWALECLQKEPQYYDEFKQIATYLLDQKHRTYSTTVQLKSASIYANSHVQNV